MLKSLRSRLLLWYSLSLSLVILVYAGTVTYLYRESLLREVDTALAASAGEMAASLTPDIDGTFDLNLPATIRNTMTDDPDAPRYFAIWDSRGDLVDQSSPEATPAAVPQPGVAVRLNRRELVIEAPGETRIMVGQRLDGLDAAVRSLGLTVTAVGLLVLVTSLIGGFVLAGRALAPVARISATAGAMIAGDLDARIPVKGTASELEQVARALNEAFDRMRMVADHQRQFTADASHELRTPLAILRAEFDWVLTRPRAAQEYRESIEKAQKAVDRMTELADRLLALMRPGSSAAMARTTVDLASLVDSSVSLLAPLAAAHQVRIHTACEAAQVSGVRSLLEDAFNNLLKNAIEYNRVGGEVFVDVRTEGSNVLATVRDTGVGIGADDLPRIFERFYRADRARTRGGAGLGLAIVRSIIEEHGGSVACSSTTGAGTTFTVRLPAATPVSAHHVPARARAAG